MHVLIYEENSYDSAGVSFVASSVKSALDVLIERQKSRIRMWEDLRKGLNPNNSQYDRHLNINTMNINIQTEELNKLQTYINSKEWTDDNIETFDFEEYYHFNWHEVL